MVYTSNAGLLQRPEKDHDGVVIVSTTWGVAALVFSFLVIGAYLLYRIAMCVERITDHVANVMDGLSGVAEPTANGINSLLSTLGGAGAIASVANATFH